MANEQAVGPMHEDAADEPKGSITGEDGLARCPWATSPQLYVDYHDTEWGMPVRGEQPIFERITLEAFQSGLSWLTILRKRPAFRGAFADFDPEVVARFSDADVERLMQDASIVRNRQKIEATRTNARAVVALRDEGGLDAFIWSHKPETTPSPETIAEVPAQTPGSKALAKALRAKGFVFVGPTTAYALMSAIGLVDTHLVGCHRRGSSGEFSNQEEHMTNGEPPITDIDTILDRIDATWSDFRQSYAGLSDDEMLIHGVTGDWSVRDILAHVAVWDAYSLEALPGMLESGKPPNDGAISESTDEFNARTTGEKRGLSLEEVRQELADTHRRLLDYLKGVPPERIAGNAPFRERLAADTWNHYPEHAAAIRAWRERQS